MKLLLALSACGILFSTVYYLAAIVTGVMFAHRSNSAPRALPKIPPRVAVLKPLRGVSEHLRENVISFLEMAYSRVEFIFGVTSYEDRAVDIPVSLRAPYQFANMTVVVGEEPGSSNRKIAKLIRMAERASDKTDIFVLSDADISVEPDHLKRVVAELTENPKTGLVTCIYRGQAYESFASRMEALFINTDFAPQVILAEALEPMKYALGATIAVKREALDAIGGFRALKDLLADDFHLGSKVSEAGYNIELSSSIVTVACEDHNFTDFWNHQLRWARTYRHARPLSLATIAIHGPFWALMYIVANRFALHSFDALAMILGLRMLMASIMIGKVLKKPQALSDVLLIPFKDLVMTAIYFASLTGRTVKWGGRRFLLMAGGVMRELA
ncbi:MAG TPA: bacteriohopanetetrol glucosamine biosynthesis glycosyltransferase HpnI [Candidatus Binataceae bacterium]|nr:bacteriohopanetetrol glucosamine biosynthesis glycosyltransferase HpnI [Candidatus Binataceae bacterium]